MEQNNLNEFTLIHTLTYRDHRIVLQSSTIHQIELPRPFGSVVTIAIDGLDMMALSDTTAMVHRHTATGICDSRISISTCICGCLHTWCYGQISVRGYQYRIVECPQENLCAVVVFEGWGRLGRFSTPIESSFYGQSRPMLWHGGDTIVYRQHESKRLVQVKISDIEQGVYDMWSYVAVPYEREDKPVISADFSAKGDLAVLWEDGAFLRSLSHKRSSRSLCMQVKIWSYVNYVFRGVVLVSGMEKLAISNDLGTENPESTLWDSWFFLAGSSSVRRIKVDSTYPGRASFIWKVAEIKRSRSDVVYMAICKSYTVHLIQCRRGVIKLLKKAIVIGPNEIKSICIGKNSDIYLGLDKNLIVELTLQF